jgi:mannitol-1-phosphate 5-dehydrogenase
MKKAVMYGAGNIGRGFIGQLLSQSGYEVVFLDINEAVISRLNADHEYPVRLISTAGAEESTVHHVRGVNSMDAELAAHEIATADLVATAVGANILPRIAPVIANALVLRWQGDNTAALNIIICENLMNAHKVLEALLLSELPVELHSRFHESVGLVEASIGRMVPVTTEAMQEGNITRVWAEPYAELPVDLDGFKGPLPEIIGMKPFSPFEFFIERKLYMHNMSHAILAYLGRLMGHEYIWQAVRDKRVADVARGALAESAGALSRKHNILLDELTAFSADLMLRFDNPLLGDTAVRVGRDTVRKLDPSDRLVGALFLCQQQGITPDYIACGIAAALLFGAEGDGASARVQQSLVENGLEATLLEYCKIDRQNAAYPSILRFYEDFSSL